MSIVRKIYMQGQGDQNWTPLPGQNWESSLPEQCYNRSSSSRYASYFVKMVRTYGQLQIKMYGKSTKDLPNTFSFSNWVYFLSCCCCCGSYCLTWSPAKFGFGKTGVRLHYPSQANLPVRAWAKVPGNFFSLLHRVAPIHIGDRYCVT